MPRISLCPHRFSGSPWREIYETDAERRQHFVEAERTYALMVAVYEECGYRCVELPKEEPALRARFLPEKLAALRRDRVEE